MRPRILLVNPPICDFTAYDYWLKPYGLLRVAGQLRGQAELQLFDFLDRLHPRMPPGLKRDPWGRGAFPAEVLPKPAALAPIRRRYHRFGLPRHLLGEFLRTQAPFDAVLVQTTMTYWYPGVREVIEEVRAASPQSAVVLGGVYATLCTAHARTLGADLVVAGQDLGPLWDLLGVQGEAEALPFWEGYKRLETGVLKLTEGCPFRCTYCSVPQLYPKFSGNVERTLAEIDLLHQRGVRRLAFYDDALLFREEELLLPLLEEVIRRGYELELHTPNALNARFITPPVAQLMVRAGFQSFYLGFESSAYTWQKKTGGKVYSAELVAAVATLEAAGADRRMITAYLIAGHPRGEQQEVEASMHFAHSLGIRLMLSEFSPIPNTPDGEACRGLVDLDEPLWHNKTAFAEHSLGSVELNRLKALCHHLNRALN
ncbi:MAG: radical SAM protein [Candidatus Latescibacteria bacterium]|nr:radical SAM protein [Candidatus Latescibacterota bacterium]